MLSNMYQSLGDPTCDRLQDYVKTIDHHPLPELPVSLAPYPLCRPPLQSVSFQLVQEEAVGSSSLELGQVSSRQDLKPRTGSWVSSASSSIETHSMPLPFCLVPLCKRGSEQHDGAWQPFSVCVCLQCAGVKSRVGRPLMPSGVHSQAQANPREGHPFLGDMSKRVGETASLQSWKGGRCTPVCESSLKEG